ncbi:hypothetical protein CEQ36_08110 [Yersinia intermedia]|jgi:hypothetical protein|nr:hypothetical protein A6J67_23335 [Yersinia sp. FDAARGOS_228]AVL35597.1 hypothetical protein CEQ36_08110 [Yersinia intermedia]OVZ76876.1 hypothetical protein CBW55_04355 [Yersinia intermedia]
MRDILNASGVYWRGLMLSFLPPAPINAGDKINIFNHHQDLYPIDFKVQASRKKQTTHKPI